MGFGQRAMEMWMEAKTVEGRSYYYNVNTRDTSWDRPTEVPGQVVVKDMANPLPPMGFGQRAMQMWMEAKTEDGRSYYYNVDTRDTSWDRPTEVPGQVVVKDVANPPVISLATGKNEKKGMPTDEPTGDGVPTSFNKKCKPVEYKAIDGSQWCVVWTNDGQVGLAFGSVT